MKNIKLLKDDKKFVESFNDEHIRLLLKSCNLKEFVGFRDYIMFILLLDTGIRLKEIAGLKLEHLNERDKTILITETKNGYQRFVPVHENTLTLLKRYIKIRGTVDTDHLFITDKNEVLAYRGIQARFQHYQKLLNFSKKRPAF